MSGSSAPCCPFYPSHCSVQYHPNMEHKWKDVTPVQVAKKVVEWPDVTHKAESVTHSAPKVTHKKNSPADAVVPVSSSEKQRRWRKAHAEDVKVRNRERMRLKRAEAK